jgi:hypothetical protein
MRLFRECVVGLITVALVGLAACATPSPDDRPANAPPTTSDRFGAPTVDHPLDVRAAVGKPCDLLTVSDLRQLGLPGTGRQRMVVDIPSCRWSAENLQDLSLALDGDRDLLADTYRTSRRGVFIPVQVLGLPAVIQKSGRGEFNSCTVTTGLGPRQALTANWTAPGDSAPGNDACEFAEQATALVIRKLPPQR